MIPGQSGFAPVANSRPLPLGEIRILPWEDFHANLLQAVSRGGRVAALFGMSPHGENQLFLVLADDTDNKLWLARTRLEGPSFPSLTPSCPQVHLFEREIAEQRGWAPQGHPWLKPVRFSFAFRSGPAAPEAAPTIGVTDFYRVEGDEIHEVAVGPVHAGVIEPGHFRFQCHGEEVLHLEISLGYQHRGVERALIGGPDKRSIHYMETLAGDSTAAHSTAYCQVMEALGRCKEPARSQVIRGIALELERIANHVGDLGALSGDVGFLPTASFCGRLRGDFLNMTALLCGNRFGRGLARPGGVRFDLSTELAEELLQRLDSVESDLASAVNLLWDTPSVMARFEGAGPLLKEDAAELGIVGPAARASGLLRDTRHDQPWGIYRFVHIPVSTGGPGDVFARAHVRWLEVQRSMAFVREQLRTLPGGPHRAECGSLAPESVCVSLVEGWRGEVCHVAVTDSEGHFLAYKVVDPSFHNWTGLALALRNQQISDFPLCNKSFNLSYCGHDL
ncbi:MAG: hydrogenase [Candidatus Omnitrophica bacterium]|nr:hydrogenase [Candidatus Omnitrophota bacterium]